MSESKHTQGPWRVGGDEVMDANGNSLACVCGDLTICEQDEANARLIAAAPEMLGALEHIVNLDRVFDVISEEFPATIKEALAAIAKAKGEESPC